MSLLYFLYIFILQHISKLAIIILIFL
jgi:hypothetical protein